jgi:hypothetical protein
MSRDRNRGSSVMSNEALDQLKNAGDAAAVVVTVGTIASFLPPAAALVTIIWTLIRIWETKTVQGWVTYMRGE